MKLKSNKTFKGTLAMKTTMHELEHELQHKLEIRKKPNGDNYQKLAY